MRIPPEDFIKKAKTHRFHNLFSLRIYHYEKNTILTMKVFAPQITTNELPRTSLILQEALPNVLFSECFNEEKLPFFEEVKATEIGHLFEHILLEYLCLEKIANGYPEATYSGNTNWDWKKDPYGTFYITINVGKHELEFFPFALKKTIALTRKIFQSSAFNFQQKEGNPQFFLTV